MLTKIKHGLGKYKRMCQANVSEIGDGVQIDIEDAIYFEIIESTDIKHSVLAILC